MIEGAFYLQVRRFLVYSLNLIWFFTLLLSFMTLIICFSGFILLCLLIPNFTKADACKASQKDEDLTTRVVRKLKDRVDVKTLGNLKVEEKVYKYGLRMENFRGDCETKSVREAPI